MQPFWSSRGSAFRTRFKNLCVAFGLQQGATHTFQQSKSMEEALLRGRWESSRVARIYIMDALSYLPSIKRSSYTASMLAKYHF